MDKYNIIIIYMSIYTDYNFERDYNFSALQDLLALGVEQMNAEIQQTFEGGPRVTQNAAVAKKPIQEDEGDWEDTRAYLTDVTEAIDEALINDGDENLIKINKNITKTIKDYIKNVEDIIKKHGRKHPHGIKTNKVNLNYWSTVFASALHFDKENFEKQMNNFVEAAEAAEEDDNDSDVVQIHNPLAEYVAKWRNDVERGFEEPHHAIEALTHRLFNMWLEQQGATRNQLPPGIVKERMEWAGDEARNILNAVGIVDDRLPHPNATGYGRGARRVGVRKTKTKTKKKSKTRGQKKDKNKKSKQGKTRRRTNRRRTPKRKRQTLHYRRSKKGAANINGNGKLGKSCFMDNDCDQGQKCRAYRKPTIRGRWNIKIKGIPIPGASSRRCTSNKNMFERLNNLFS
jgi:hypothetical protein